MYYWKRNSPFPRQHNFIILENLKILAYNILCAMFYVRKYTVYIPSLVKLEITWSNEKIARIKRK